MHPPILSTPQLGETLYTYLAVSKQVVSVVLFWNEENNEKLVYYVSKALLEAKQRYNPLE